MEGAELEKLLIYNALKHYNFSNGARWKARPEAERPEPEESEVFINIL